MITVSIKIESDNEAFAEQLEVEVARIISEAAGRIANGPISTPLFDINGNKVGTLYYDITEEEEEEEWP